MSNQVTLVSIPPAPFETSESSGLILTDYDADDVKKTITALDALKTNGTSYRFIFDEVLKQGRFPFDLPDSVISSEFEDGRKFTQIVIRVLTGRLNLTPPLTLQQSVNGILWVNCTGSSGVKEIFDSVDKVIKPSNEDRARWNAVKEEITAKINDFSGGSDDGTQKILSHLGTRLQGCGTLAVCECKSACKCGYNAKILLPGQLDNYFKRDTSEQEKREIERELEKLERTLGQLFKKGYFPLSLKKKTFIELGKIEPAAINSLISTVYYFLLNLSADIDRNTKAIECLDCCLKWLHFKDEIFVADIYSVLSSGELKELEKIRPAGIRGLIRSRLKALYSDLKKEEKSLPSPVKNRYHDLSIVEPHSHKNRRNPSHLKSATKNPEAYYRPDEYQKAVEQNWDLIEDFLEIDRLAESWLKIKFVIDDKDIAHIDVTDRCSLLEILKNLLKIHPKRNSLFLAALTADSGSSISENISKSIKHSLEANRKQNS